MELRQRPAQSAGAKLRLMCSYGGRLIPRPQSKSLYYHGGETRIVSVDRSPSLFALWANLSTALSIMAPFALKYQLPDSDLDDLISLCTDDDLAVMIDELDRLSSTPAAANKARPSRIRLFLFTSGKDGDHRSETESAQSVLCHPKTETWFIDALKGAKIVGKESDDACFGGFGGGDGHLSEGLSSGGGGGVCAESVVLETSSSFGSTSSSVSLSSFPPLVAHFEDGGVNSQDCKAKLMVSLDSVSRDSDGLASNNSNSHTATYNVPVSHVASLETKSSSTIDPKGTFFCSGIHPCSMYPVSGYPVTSQYDHLQHVPFVPTGTPIMSQNPAFVLPFSQYYPVYHMQPQPLCYPPNQSYPTYIVPMAGPKPQNLPMQSRFHDGPVIVPTQRPVDFGPLVNPPVACKEVTEPMKNPELGSTGVTSVEVASPLDHVPLTENHQKLTKPNEVEGQLQPVDVVPEETCYNNNGINDDPARLQIYKSQPLPPTLPSQYQTMTEATTLMLTEALSQLNTDCIKQQSKT